MQWWHITVAIIAYAIFLAYFFLVNQILLSSPHEAEDLDRFSKREQRENARAGVRRHR